MIHHRTCHLCEAMCGLAIEVSDGKITAIRGDEQDPFSRGHLCPKAVALQDLHDDPDRLRHPLRRTATGWEAVSWPQALAEVAGRLMATQREFGRHAVAVYQGNPIAHNFGLALAGVRFSKALRTHNRFSATSADQLPHMVAALLMFGHQLLLPVPDLDRTRYMLMLGANPLASNGSLMTAPDVKRRLEELTRRGRLVVIDPRRTETARLASAHYFITPGTDALFLCALLHALFSDGHAKPGRLAGFSDGIDTVRRLVEPFTPEAVAAATGIDAATTRAIARDFAAADGAVCYGRIGIATQEFGGLACWLVNVVNLVTGNLDRAGGAMFTTPALDLVALATRLGLQGRFGTWKSSVRGLPEFAGELPVAALAEEIEARTEARVRALVTIAGNPVLSSPNGGRLDGALSSLDFMVSIDPYLNETTRHAHFILPPTSPLEHDHYDYVFHALAIRNTAKYSPALFDPPAGALHDAEILGDLACRIEARGSSPGYRLRRLATDLATPARLLDLLLRRGPHGDRYLPWRRGLSLSRLRAAVHGVDLGPLEPRLPARLGTPDRRIQVAPAPFVVDVARLLARLRDAPAGASIDLRLIGRRHLLSNNSWMHNSARLVKGPSRCTLLMHPADAAARGLADGTRVRVSSRVGSIEAPLAISDEIAPGVVSLPHGFGHGRPGIRAAVASAHAGVSVNDLTDELRIDPLTGNADFNGVPVRVAAVSAGAAASPLSGG